MSLENWGTLIVPAKTDKRDFSLPENFTMAPAVALKQSVIQVVTINTSKMLDGDLFAAMNIENL